MACPYSVKTRKESVLDALWGVERGKRKERGTGGANDCSVTEDCIHVKATPQESSAFRAVLSSSSVVPCDLGWVLGGVTNGSARPFFLVTCLLPASGFVIPLMLTSAVFLRSLISGL